jgi:pseudouridine-5'-phosphate glycosidase
VVALESTIVAHGLPRPDNLAVARQIEDTVRAHGAQPATVGVVGGRIVVGLDDAELTGLATSERVAKLSVRDLAPAAASGVDGVTTVASTAAIAMRAGIGVFATGGLGGVHREAATSFDESADLSTLARTSVCVVCAGVKSILDVPATLERLESLGVTVIGYRTRRFPGFYLTDSGHEVDWSVSSPVDVARVLAARAGHGLTPAAVLVANPLPVSEQLDPETHDRVLTEGLARAAAEGITGKQVTPFLLGWFHRATEGRSIVANIRIILRNAELAARIAAASADLPVSSDPTTGPVR